MKCKTCNQEVKEWVKHTITEKTLEWGAVSDEEMNWEDAKKWCEEQGGRLPTALELQQAYADKVEGFTQSSNYWSATTYPASYSYAMVVFFYVGYSSSFGKTNSFYVRCVRG